MLIKYFGIYISFLGMILEQTFFFICRYFKLAVRMII